jgi:hypothetical protein
MVLENIFFIYLFIDGFKEEASGIIGCESRTSFESFTMVMRIILQD